MVSTPTSWSRVLRDIMKSSAEQQRLATALGVTSMTLSRWASGESRPQKSHLIHLLQVVTIEQRQELIEALKENYPEVQSWLTEDTCEQIPTEFFAQVLSIRTTTAESLRFWRISDVVLKQALEQLDPNDLGMTIRIVQCMKPHAKDNRVRSLRERSGKGTPPWSADLEHDIIFLGLESLCGYCVDVRHIVSNQDLKSNTADPSVQDAHEVSAAAHPIRFGGNVAGCLLASSTKKNYFTPQRLHLLTCFSDLIALAFDKEDFYPSYKIELRAMPKPEVQRPMLANFRQRVTDKFLEAMKKKERINNIEIELQAWQELENELLTYQKNSISEHASS